MATGNSHYLFRHHPETCDPSDVWGQVKRTVHGKPVAPEQIDMIVNAITTGLELTSDDVLLDLCCGNGALTARLFAACSGGLGVDYSAFLIDVARHRFSCRVSERYILADALDYLQDEARTQTFTKVLCYGAFPYFDNQAARLMLRTLNARFDRATHVFVGQIPDKTRLEAFFFDRMPPPDEVNNPGGALGLWRTPSELQKLALETGWDARCENMPAGFYAAHYRFDAILTRR